MNNQQKGNSSLNLIIITILGLSISYAAVSKIKNMHKSKASLEETNIGKKRNQAAIELVSQLISSGALYYDKTIIKQNTQIEESSNSKWIYKVNYKTNNPFIKVTICEKKTAKTAKVTPNSTDKSIVDPTLNLCNNDELGRYVDVEFMKYLTKDKVTDNPDGTKTTVSKIIANVEATSYTGENKHKTKAKIALGGEDGGRTDEAVAQTDFCYFAQLSDKTNIKAYNKSLKGYEDPLKIAGFLKPRAEPKDPKKLNSNEFAGKFTIDPPKSAESYQILKGYRKQILSELKKLDEPNPKESYRGLTISFKDLSTNENIEEVFVGVMPTKPDSVAQFQYFLAADVDSNKNVIKHYSKATNDAFTEWDNSTENLTRFNNGCKTTTGDARPQFCTRVDIAFQEYSAGINKKCILTPKTLKPGESIIKIPKNETICDKEYPNKVDEFVNTIETPDPLDPKKTLASELATNTKATEVSISAYIAMMNGDINEKDNNKKLVIPEEIRTKFLDKFPIETQIIEKNNDTVDKNVEYWVLKSLESAVNIATHDSKRCAYFKYYDAHLPQECKIEVLTQAEDGAWVCRTADGCFDINTKIRMFSGEDKVITELKKGDLVYNPKTQKPVKINYLTVGPEKEPMYYINVDNKTLKITKKHPFFTLSGWKEAYLLNTNDLIFNTENKFSKIKSIEIQRSTEEVIVANLYLDNTSTNYDDHFVLANGIPTGDLFIQQELAKKE